jgi:hypothetical protein
MPSNLTQNQILAMAPDASAAKAGQGLANPAKWVSLGCSNAALWGACQGSGANPYEVAVDLGEPAFRCSCPSHKFPCKHGLGLLLIFASSPAAFTYGDAPARVLEWLAKRGEKAERSKPQEGAKAPPSEEQAAKAAEDQAKRATQRAKKVTKGVQDLRVWLADLVRSGIASPQSRQYSFWEGQAKRMEDAQAPGITRMLRELAAISASGEGWQSRRLEQIGLLYLLLDAHDRLDSLPEPIQADVREAIGWSVRQETVLAGESLSDVWSVVGQRSYDEEHLRVTRTWLMGAGSRRFAMILQFTRPGQALDPILIPGLAFEADLVFFPGSNPMRALINSRKDETAQIMRLDVVPDLESMLDAYSDLYAASVWNAVLPAAVGGVVPARQGDRWLIRDRCGAALPVSRTFEQPWKLLGISGGRSVDLFAEWNGRELFPLGVSFEGRYAGLR